MSVGPTLSSRKQFDGAAGHDSSSVFKNTARRVAPAEIFFERDVNIAHFAF